METLFQCVIVEDDARSGDRGHDWPHALNRPRPHDRDKEDPGLLPPNVLLNSFSRLSLLRFHVLLVVVRISILLVLALLFSQRQQIGVASGFRLAIQ